MFSLDCIHLAARSERPEATALVRLGLKEGSPNKHPGQGTAWRRFSFANSYPESLWLSDVREAQSELVHRTRLWQRWSGGRVEAHVKTQNVTDFKYSKLSGTWRGASGFSSSIK
jgi:hypothetical protein